MSGSPTSSSFTYPLPSGHPTDSGRAPFFFYPLFSHLLGHPTGSGGPLLPSSSSSLFSFLGTPHGFGRASHHLFALSSLFCFLPSLFFGHLTGSAGLFSISSDTLSVRRASSLPWATLRVRRASSLPWDTLRVRRVSSDYFYSLFPFSGTPYGLAGPAIVHLLFSFFGTPYGLAAFFLLFSCYLVFSQNALPVAYIPYPSIYYTNPNPVLTLRTLTLC